MLLPADHAMSPAETSMAIAHELAHLQRGDLWLAWLPAVAQRLFFFHPAVTWALREYALNREAACDARVLEQTGVVPQAYGHLLLRLGVARPIAGRPGRRIPHLHQSQEATDHVATDPEPARPAQIAPGC